MIDSFTYFYARIGNKARGCTDPACCPSSKAPTSSAQIWFVSGGRCRASTTDLPAGWNLQSASLAPSLAESEGVVRSGVPSDAQSPPYATGSQPPPLAGPLPGQLTWINPHLSRPRRSASILGNILKTEQCTNSRDVGPSMFLRK